MARGDPINRGALSGYVASALERGLSQRGALRELRDAGLGIQDKALRGVWNEVRSVREKAGAIADLGGREVVPSDLHTTRDSQSRDGFLYNVQVMLRDEDGSTLSRPHSVASDDPMMVDDILAVVAEETEAGLEVGSGAGVQYAGAVVVSAYEMVTGR